MICIDRKQYDEQGPIPMKLVAVGDGAVGKTYQIIDAFQVIENIKRYMNESYNEEHIPTVFENSFMMVKIDKKTVQLGIWDTAGQEEYNRLRPLSYSNTDIFLIVFSVVDPESFDNALKKWYPELQQVQPKSLKVFVGNKIDLLEQEQNKKKSQKNAPINSQQVKQIVNELGCEYYECSAKLDQGVKELFLKSIQVGMNQKQQNQKPRKHKQCNLI